MKAKTAIGASIALALAASLATPRAQAGIFRDVLSSVGLAKPDPAPTSSDGTPSFPRQGYACCDLHYAKQWISDSNYSQLPLIAAGTPIEVVNYGRNRANIKIDGKPMQLGLDYGREQEMLDAWVRKIIVDKDPRPRIATYPATFQEAIRQGKVMLGMTREQCIVAVGYPLANENVTLDAASWRMWRSSGEEYLLNFGPDGRVSSITGDPGVIAQVRFYPGH